MRHRTMSFKGFPQPGREFSVHDYIPGQPIPALILDPDDPQGERVIVNPLKKWVTPFTMVTDPGVITLGPNQISEPIPMVIDGKGHFEIFDAFFHSTREEGFTVTLLSADAYDGSEARPILMNREIHVATIASGGGATLPLSGAFPASTSGGRPYRWPENYWLDVSQKQRGAMIVAVFRNLSSSSADIRFNLHGRRWYYMQAEPKVAQRMEEIFRGRPRSIPYFWTTDEWVEVDSSSTPEDFQIRLGDDAWSELIKMTQVSTTNYDILLKETASGRKFMDQLMQNTLVFGSGEFPLMLAESTLLEPNMKLTAQILYPSGVAPNVIFLTIAGRKIFADDRDSLLLRPSDSPGRS